MSDGESPGTDASTGAPLDAPNGAAPVEAPAEKAQKVEKPAEPVEKKAPPKPRTPDDDLEDWLKKNGGLKYKAKGADKTATSVADLRRLLSSRDSESTAISEAAKDKREAAELRNNLASIAKLPPRERLGALQRAGIDPKVIQDAVEESILEADERSKAQSHLTPREREYEAKLREREEELTRFHQEREQQERARQEDAWVQESDGLYTEMIKAAGGAFETAGIKDFSLDTNKALVSAILPTLAQHIDRNKRLGLELDAGEMAEIVTTERAKIVDEWNLARPLEDLAASLESMMVVDPDPSKPPGSKISRLKLLMLSEAAKIRARQNGGTPAPVRTTQHQQQNGREMTAAEKMDAARTFGGGVR